MLDTVNTERYSIIRQKFLKLKAGNYSANAADGYGGVPQPSGVGQISASLYSRQTKMWKMWIPGKKIVRSGVVKYEDATAQTKFFDYYVLMYAYSNYTTLQDVWNVARNNDYVKQMYFKDA